MGSIPVATSPAQPTRGGGGVEGTLEGAARPVDILSMVGLRSLHLRCHYRYGFDLL